ncbi:uncharacterized protein LOC106464378 [Limulus polyphemus]|uniref:Uncharacterized protein LOC106464378 n=1 Tax=Limulus polyphemus TaxID=6850 RepID=A0ABM1BDU3_LIMPO|nr:uncharacterized protein LOC106464378 [Limulus polyphemus]
MRRRFKSILITLLFVYSLDEASSSIREENDVTPASRDPVKRPIGTLIENDQLPKTHNGNNAPSLAEATNDKILHFLEEKALERLLSEFTLKRSSKPAEKRNIAHLARKGWLTTLRAYRPTRPPPKNRYSQRIYRYNWKREMLPSGDEPANFKENGSFFKDYVELNDDECIETGDALEPDLLTKRNIGALARSGKLPRSHGSTNWWELKRDNYVTPVRRFFLVIPNDQLSIKHQLTGIQEKKCKTVR